MPDRPRYDDESFEQLLSRLEEITDRLASSDVGIEEAADLYEQAELLHGLAAARLARVQARIESLAGGAPAASPGGVAPLTGNEPATGG